MGTNDCRDIRILNFRSLIIPAGTVIRSATFVLQPYPSDCYSEADGGTDVPSDTVDEINRVIKQNKWSDKWRLLW